MDKEILRKVQLVQLDIAKEVDRICKKHNIKYFLLGGTLIGAVRHKGFIPWDDDLDIGMLRSDYDKFFKIAQNELCEKYEIVDWKKDPYYPHPMAKVVKKGTIYRENKRKDKGNHGIWIDLFPYDKSNVDDRKRKKTYFRLKLLRSLIRAKCNYQTWNGQQGIKIGKYLKNIPPRLLSILFSKKYLVKKYEEIVKNNYELKEYKFFENGVQDYNKFQFSKDLFDNIIWVDFEGYKFPIIDKYDEFLRQIYGDYMILPPENERGNQHMIVEVDFGD